MMAKKKIILVSMVMAVLILLIIFGALPLAAFGGTSHSPGSPPPAANLLVIGHRGAAGLAPENTLTAFQKACDTGVDAVELDVFLTEDSNIVVYHDYQLKPDITRNSDGRWLGRAGPAIRDLTLIQLKRYDVGRLKPGTQYARRYPYQVAVDGERIPTLAEAIALIEDRCNHETELWIEIKSNPEKPNLTPVPEIIAGEVVKLLREEDITDRVRVLSFDWRVLGHVQKIARDIPTVYLSHVGIRLNNIKPGRPGASPWMAGLDIDNFQGSIPRAVKASGGKHWAPYYKYITDVQLKEAHRLGIKVYGWTVDSGTEMFRLIDLGIDGIITNRPDILKSVLVTLQSKSEN
jgi:glycerophosphoryl diester phosphodiesterase